MGQVPLTVEDVPAGEHAWRFEAERPLLRWNGRDHYVEGQTQGQAESEGMKGNLKHDDNDFRMGSKKGSAEPEDSWHFF